MNSDKQGLPPRTIHSLGQESMARVGTGCMWQQADFPANAFSRADTGPLHGRKPVCINLNNAAHEG
jgi:hypothetical protein